MSIPLASSLTGASDTSLFGLKSGAGDPKGLGLQVDERRWSQRKLDARREYLQCRLVHLGLSGVQT